MTAAAETQLPQPPTCTVCDAVVPLPAGPEALPARVAWWTVCAGERAHLAASVEEIFAKPLPPGEPEYVRGSFEIAVAYACCPPDEQDSHQACIDRARAKAAQ